MKGKSCKVPNARIVESSGDRVEKWPPGAEIVLVTGKEGIADRRSVPVPRYSMPWSCPWKSSTRLFGYRIGPAPGFFCLYICPCRGRLPRRADFLRFHFSPPIEHRIVWSQELTLPVARGPSPDLAADACHAEQIQSESPQNRCLRIEEHDGT